MNLRGLLFLFVSTTLLSCGNDMDKYPPLTWNDTKLDSVLGSFGNTRGDAINDFTDKNGVYIRCLFDGTDYKKMFENETEYGFQDSSQAFDYRSKMCDLIHETKASLIYSNNTHGDLTVLKYKDGTELYYIKDTSGANLSGNEYWKTSLKNNLRKSKLFKQNWYLNKNGHLFKLPD